MPLAGVDGSDTEAAWTTALAAHLGGEAEQEIDGVVAGRVDVLTGTQAIELDWLKGNKFHEGIGQALHYGDVTGQQPPEFSGAVRIAILPTLRIGRVNPFL